MQRRRRAGAIWRVFGRIGAQMIEKEHLSDGSRITGRRRLFSPEPCVQRPPWSTEKTVRATCTSCGECIAACPEAILMKGPAGTPVVNFMSGECTFCAACADACPEAVFGDTGATPWTIVAEIDSSCLLENGVSCRTCTDVCEPNALHFDLKCGAFGAIHVDVGACSGCGACLGICPVGAIKIKPLNEKPMEPAE
jgi:ferredoxin-type protein NapF